MWPPPLSLTAHQLDQFAELERIALSFNARHNLYSQASTREFRERHLVHSLALAERPFPPGSVIVDWGTGGGMPGLVLAIAFPDLTFHLVDSVDKKVRAVRSMARRLGLENVATHHTRAEEWEGRASHSVSRATAPLHTLWSWHQRVSDYRASRKPEWAAGLICLKGGDLSAEVALLQKSDSAARVTVRPLPPWCRGPEFEGKVIVEVEPGDRAEKGVGEEGIQP
jgi:16S rRNA (guanine527-N7)-methyltransferase